jgi:hypothetical protein
MCRESGDSARFFVIEARTLLQQPQAAWQFFFPPYFRNEPTLSA